MIKVGDILHFNYGNVGSEWIEQITDIDVTYVYSKILNCIKGTKPASKAPLGYYNKNKCNYKRINHRYSKLGKALYK